MYIRPPSQNNLPTRQGRVAKAEVVAALRGELEGARLVVVVGYHGVNGPKARELRSWAHAQGARLRVVKNRLARRALAGSEVVGLEASLRGGCALLMATEAPDAVLLSLEHYIATRAPIKILRKTAGPDRVRKAMGEAGAAYARGHRPNPNQLTVRAAWLDGALLDEADRVVLREAGGLAGLRRGLLVQLQAPPRRLLSMLSAPQRRLLWLLHAYAEALAGRRGGAGWGGLVGP